MEPVVSIRAASLVIPSGRLSWSVAYEKRKQAFALQRAKAVYSASIVTTMLSR
jgi:hypothetical protein